MSTRIFCDKCNVELDETDRDTIRHGVRIWSRAYSKGRPSDDFDYNHFYIQIEAATDRHYCGECTLSICRAIDCALGEQGFDLVPFSAERP